MLRDMGPFRALARLAGGWRCQFSVDCSQARLKVGLRRTGTPVLPVLPAAPTQQPPATPAASAAAAAARRAAEERVELQAEVAVLRYELGTSVQELDRLQAIEGTRLATLTSLTLPAKPTLQQSPQKIRYPYRF